MFRNSILTFTAAFFLAVSAYAVQDVVSATHGTITKLDAATRTMLVKMKDGTEATFHFVDKTAVHGAEGTATGAKDAFHGLTEGSEVIAHYTEKGGDKTAIEVDRVGKGGLKAMEGTVVRVGKAGKTIAVKTGDGTEETFRVTGRDTAAAAEDIGKATDKSAKVTVYYTEDAGKKVLHALED